MYVTIVVLLICAAAVHAQPPVCAYHNDRNSPFFWKNHENVCTDKLCQENPWLQCGVPKDYVLHQADGHMPEDILYEVELLQSYFNTHVKRPVSGLPYNCEGVCEKQSKRRQLERIFTKVKIPNGYGQFDLQHHMCIVIGPDIEYVECGGNCEMPRGGNADKFCVPDVVVSLDIWVFCPEIVKYKCHKVRFDVPVSCTCKSLMCKPGKSANITLIPNVPGKPSGWKPGNNPYPFHALKQHNQLPPVVPIHTGTPIDHANPTDISHVPIDQIHPADIGHVGGLPLSGPPQHSNIQLPVGPPLGPSPHHQSGVPSHVV